MISNKILELRKLKNISQEELALVLNTSRQAISKWERGEAYPDLDRLKDLATYFDVSIDYLLEFDIASIGLNDFIEKLKKCTINKTFDISIDEIKMIVLKNNNNFNILLYVANYLIEYWKAFRKEDIIDLVIYYCERMILVYREDNMENITIKNIKKTICYCYIIKKRYDLVKEYIKNNDLSDLSVYIAECDYHLGNYELASKAASNAFLESIAKLLNANTTQLKLLLKKNKIEEAYDLVKWCISLIKSIEKNEDLLLDGIYILVFTKASCESNLGLDYSESLLYLKNNSDVSMKKKFDSVEIKFYHDEKVNFSTLITDIKQELYDEIEFLKDSIIYKDMNNIYNKIYGEKR